MKQIYHSNATTDVPIRCELQKSNLPMNQLATQYHLSENTVLKWKDREEAVEKWYELKPEIFLEKPLEFKNKILLLHHHIISKQDCLTQQSCET